MVTGISIAVWGFIILGFKRSMCLNFYRKDIEIVRAKLYQYIKNPLDYGLWTLLVGYALLSTSLYNLTIAIEFIIVMIPHIYVENIPIRNDKQPG